MSASRRFAALDLGTARTRALILGGQAIADRPSVVVRRSSAAGEVDVVRPVRHGMVADPGACVRLVRLALRDTRLYDSRPLERVLAGVPVAASAGDRAAVRAAVAGIAGCEVVLVEEPLAAAVGAGLDVLGGRPRLLLDVGAGIVEAVVLRDGGVSDAVSLQLSTTTGAGPTAAALESVVDMTAGLLRRLPAAARPAVRALGLVITGGGAHHVHLLRRLRAALRAPVTAAPEPQYAIVRGLMRLCLRPDLAGDPAPPVR
ncbi:rod shape-determining protein [Nonomuraea gerenzanensis]|uniref:Rod shape-determining protein MreB n=1 Tax=Nonomuraea gerenzanensis TaxID=93944 RepID=A0A1M4EMC5_9ACTN|nr:rod shape-determining protein [Nonomuraea gerenzanensis]UBU11499.1 rod shape-determining protein [Nonomuraea gerenzanensis]SBO99987.1 Rod shape-determining protein MreB [Nonomuraea gerenzanensis]